MRIQSVIAVTASLIVLFATCSVAHAAPPTACQLLDAQTAASLAGGAVGAPIDAQGILCGYGAKSGGANVTFHVDYAPGSDGSDMILAMRMAASQVGTSETIPGLGDRNLLSIMRPMRNALMVYYHGKMLQLSVDRPMTPDLKAAMIQAMRQMLGKL